MVKYTKELLGHNDFNLSISSDKLNDNDYSWDVYDECLIEKYKDDIPNSVQYISINDIPEHKYRYEYEDEKEEFDSDNQEEEKLLFLALYGLA